MAYEFKKLSELEALDAVPEGASVLAEVGGEIKRVPGEGLGGSASVPVFDLSAMGLSNIPADGTKVSAECDVTEMQEAMAKGVVKIKANVQVNSDLVFPLEAVAAPLYDALSNVYGLSCMASLAGTLMVAVFQIYGGTNGGIDAQIYILATATA